MITYLTQQRRFRSLRKQLPAVYDRLKGLGKEPFVLPFWDGVNKKIVKALMPTPTNDFLDIRAIKDTMFVAGSDEWLNTQVNYLQNKLGRDYHKLTREDRIGKPALLSAPHAHTSHNTLHHLYHMHFFMEKTRTEFNDISSVVEWGGGYGNFAKLWYRLTQGNVTYTIIDTALFCSLQWLYLSSVLGRDAVHILDHKGAKIQKGKINIVPLALLDKTTIEGDLFVSTWGLSESAPGAQDYVVDKKWFGAQHLLIGFQDSNDDLQYASRLGEIARKHRARIIDIDFIPQNHYALK